jgi:group I intron endonuclease
MKVAGIYKIVRIGTKQCYVGSSAWIKKRWAVHKRELNNDRHQATYLQNSWNKHGAEAFEFTILEVCESTELRNLLFAREQHWMDMLKPCFNTCPAAASTLGFKMPREIVERHRQQITGRKLAPEHAAIVRGLALGLKRSPETREKQRQNGIRRGIPRLAIDNSANARRGKKLTTEHLEKVRQALTGRKHSAETIAKMKACNTAEMREIKGASSRGKQQSPEHLAKRIASSIQTKAIKKLERERIEQT